VVFTVFSKRNKKLYEEMGRLPLEDEEYEIKEDEK